MDVSSPRCCGLDVPKRAVVACLLPTDANGASRRAIGAFGTLTEGTVYRDLGANSFDTRDRQGVMHRLAPLLEDQGYTVKLAPAATD